MHHVFLAPVLSIDCTRTAYPKLTFVNVPPVPHETASIYSQSLVEPHRPGRTSSEHDDIAAAARPAESLAPRRTQITRHPDPSTVAEGSSADLSWSISHSHLQPPAPSPIHVPSKRQKRQHEAEPAQAPISTRMTRRGKLLEPSEESINIGPTPSIMRDHLAASQEARPATRETDEVTRLPDHFVKASELVRRAIGPRRSSRLRLSEGSTTMAIDLPDSLVSLNTTTTLTPPSQSSAPGLPIWTIPLSRLSTLQSILSPRGGTSARSAKVSVIVCVVSTEPAVQRQRKEEKTRGQEGSLWIFSWKVVAPPMAASGSASAKDVGGEASCHVKLWNEAAREWEGRVRRGDVVLLENVEYKAATTHDPPSLSVSMPSFRSATAPKITVLYRTIPRRMSRGRASDYAPPRLAALQHVEDDDVLPEDRALRPDLRLYRSDIGIRKVREVADWFARWVGGEGPPV